MDKTDAVFYTKKLPHGYNCHMPVIKYVNTSIPIGDGAIIVIDMVPGKGQEMHNGKKQIDYMKEVFDELKSKTLTINCGIGDPPKRIQDLIHLNTVKCKRDSSGSVLRGSVGENAPFQGTPLIEVIGTRNPIIVMGFDANVCVKSSIFGSDQKGAPNRTDHIVGLLDLEKTVITSRVLLEPLNTRLDSRGGSYGILDNQ